MFPVYTCLPSALWGCGSEFVALQLPICHLLDHQMTRQLSHHPRSFPLHTELRMCQGLDLSPGKKTPHCDTRHC